MRDRRAERVAALEAHVLEGPGELAGTMRRAAAAGASLTGAAGAYSAKVRAHAYKVVDADVEALRAQGWSDDQIFELTVAVALGEGLRRLRAGLGALAGDSEAARP